MTSPQKYDVALIGGGIMSATLGTLLKYFKPDLKVIAFERLPEIAAESSNPWNNAGTGHAALCELNYMPNPEDPSKAIAINEQFQLSRQLWSSLVDKKILKDPNTFIHHCPHMTFVRGEKDVAYLEKRFKTLSKEPLFAGIEFSKDPKQISKWAPLITDGRDPSEKIAATRIETGTDVDFGAITHQLFEHLAKQGVELLTNAEIRVLNKQKDGSWNMVANAKQYNAKFVFVGAGGYALKLLQKSGIEEAKGYGTFPISGEFYRTDNPELVKQHQAKVYSQAAVGAPPMSVPHLDTRVVDGKASLLFGPYAGANPKFLKKGSILDLPLSVRPGNLIPYLAVAAKNLGLLNYLVGELAKTKQGKFDSLKEFVPNADPKDWYLITAGQRAQVIKKDAKQGGTLQFGTEVISAEDGTIAGLLGASPGASTSVAIMIDVLKQNFKKDFPKWESKLKELIPSYGEKLNSDPKKAAANLAKTAKALKIE